MLEGVRIDLQKKSLAEQVFQHIKRMILSEELTGGQRIPEEHIAQAFGVSRTPIREALRKLEKNGLVNIVPRSHAEVIQLDLVDAKHIGEARIALECMAVRLLAEGSTPEDCAELRRISEEVRKFAEKGDIGEVFEKDNDLHTEIARRSGNPYLCELLKNLGIKIQLLRTTTCVTIDSIREDIGRHELIIGAVENHKASKAVELMREHIEHAMSHIA